MPLCHDLPQSSYIIIILYLAIGSIVLLLLLSFEDRRLILFFMILTADNVWMTFHLKSEIKHQYLSCRAASDNTYNVIYIKKNEFIEVTFVCIIEIDLK